MIISDCTTPECRLRSKTAYYISPQNGIAAPTARTVMLEHRYFKGVGIVKIGHKIHGLLSNGEDHPCIAELLTPSISNLIIRTSYQDGPMLVYRSQVTTVTVLRKAEAKILKLHRSERFY